MRCHHHCAPNEQLRNPVENAIVPTRLGGEPEKVGSTNPIRSSVAEHFLDRMLYPASRQAAVTHVSGTSRCLWSRDDHLWNI